MCDHTKSGKSRNADIWDKVGVVFVVDKMKKVRLMWFGHVERRCTDASEEVQEIGYRRYEER